MKLSVKLLAWLIFGALFLVRYGNGGVIIDSLQERVGINITEEITRQSLIERTMLEETLVQVW